ncbi:MAG: HEAT repeat domain-containing protein [Spirochaetaceae bacterium]|jgi:hypothetical protein|nr:HEAT repeat domain-containing protein [Spirochaetaceae bacterium]
MLYLPRNNNNKLLLIAVFCAFASVTAAAQDLSVEDSYLQKSVESMIISEQAKSGDRENKYAALQYIRQAIDSGQLTDDVQEILSYMALEGILNKVRVEGRTFNNYPDVRMKAVEYLGDLKGQAASAALIRVLLVENEPHIAAEAVRSLTKHGFGENSYALDVILYVFRKYDSKIPSNVLAISVIDSCLAFTEGGGAKNPWVYSTLLHISKNPSYVRPVREHAGETLGKVYAKNGS